MYEIQIFIVEVDGEDEETVATLRPSLWFAFSHRHTLFVLVCCTQLEFCTRHTVFNSFPVYLYVSFRGVKMKRMHNRLNWLHTFFLKNSIVKLFRNRRLEFERGFLFEQVSLFRNSLVVCAFLRCSVRIGWIATHETQRLCKLKKKKKKDEIEKKRRKST